MSTTRPGYYPRHDINGTNLVEPEDSNFWFAGYPEGLPVPSGDHNGKMSRSGDWHKYADLNGLHNLDWLDAATTFALTSTALTYSGGNVLTTGAIVATSGAYLINGTRIDTDAPFLNPVGGTVQGSPLVYPGATAPGRIWIYANDDGEVRYTTVAAGVADAPGAGEITLNGIDYDVLGAVTDGAVAPVTLPLPTYSLGVVIPLLLEDVTITGAETVLRVTGGGVTGGGAAVVINSGIGPGQTTLSTSPSDPAVLATNLSGGLALSVKGPAECDLLTADAITVLGGQAQESVMIASAPAHASLSVTGNGSTVLAQSAIVCDGGSGFALSVKATGTVPAAVMIHTGASASCLEVYGLSNGVNGTSTDNGAGVGGTGGPNSASGYGLDGLATNAGAHGVRGRTAAVSAVTTYGVAGIGGATSGSGLLGQASGDGYGAVLQADTTSPVRSALRFVPQNADASSPQQGDMLFNDSRNGSTLGRLRYFTSTWESIHSSPKGTVRAFGIVASGSTSGGSGNLSLVAVTPEQVGDLLVTSTGHLEFALDQNACTITVVDATSGVTLASSYHTSVDPAGTVTNHGVFHSTFTVRGIRTVPSTAARTFATVVTANIGTIVYANVITSVEGIQ